MKPARSSRPGEVRLRDVRETDLPIFHRQQLDPEAVEMAAFPARDWGTFVSHWQRILADETILKQAILFNGQVAGNIASYEEAGRRLVGYWLGREY